MVRSVTGILQATWEVTLLGAHVLKFMTFDIKKKGLVRTFPVLRETLTRAGASQAI